MTTFDLSAIDGPHRGQPVLREGPDPGGKTSGATAAMVLIHGRGARAQDILMLGRAIVAAADRRDVLLLAPQAAGATWYPERFIAPVENNQPWLDSARAAVSTLLEGLIGAGMSRERIVLAGFSQGACLASDIAVSLEKPLGGVFVLSGGLIGPLGTRFAPTGSLPGTPVFVGCSDTDPHIPVERVHETTAAFRAVGAVVDERIYPGMPHTVNEDELTAMSAVLRAL